MYVLFDRMSLSNGCKAVFQSVYRAVLPDTQDSLVEMWEDQSTVTKCEYGITLLQ